VININIGTLLIHLALFLVMVGIINALLVQPLLKVMDERENRVSGNRAAAEGASQSLEAMKKSYLEKLDLVRKQASQEKEAMRKTAQAEEEKVIRAARDKAGSMVADLRQRVAGEYQGARDQLVSSSQDMGRQIAARILGRSI
jgi:F-type H+-transporting ATPase subunit b